jgi:anti-sigma B factor antagonist
MSECRVYDIPASPNSEARDLGLEYGEMCVDLSITTDIVDGVQVIRVEGELDVYAAPRLKEALAEGLERSTLFVLDLSRVQFIDSTALGVLVASLQQARAASSDFRLVLDDPYLLKIFHITGFDGVFSIFPGVAEAIQSD